MAGPRLLDRVRAAIRTRQYSYRTEQAYVHWIRRFILFHGRRHPREMGKREVEAFLTHLAVDRHVSPSTQNQALSAILFLYKAVLERELEWVDDVVRAKRRIREPVVLAPQEAHMLLAHLPEPYHLMTLLMYGAGLRLRGCCSAAGSACAARPMRWRRRWMRDTVSRDTIRRTSAWIGDGAVSLE